MPKDAIDLNGLIQRIFAGKIETDQPIFKFFDANGDEFPYFKIQD